MNGMEGILGVIGAEDPVTANGLAGTQDMLTGARSRGQVSSLPKTEGTHSCLSWVDTFSS